MSAVEITVFSDFACPYSYVTEALLWPRDEAGEVSVHYRAFELHPDPAAAAPPSEEERPDALAELAADAGVEMGAPAFRPRTRKAHEAFRFAAERGLGREMRAALFRAYWAEERDIGRIDVLTGLAEGLGLDPDELKIALDIDRFAEEVQADGAMAGRLRVRAVPVVFVGSGPEARILVGAQPRPALDAALRSR